MSETQEQYLQFDHFLGLKLHCQSFVFELFPGNIVDLNRNLRHKKILTDEKSERAVFSFLTNHVNQIRKFRYHPGSAMDSKLRKFPKIILSDRNRAACKEII